jgi:hypothetical protein
MTYVIDFMTLVVSVIYMFLLYYFIIVIFITP